MCTFQSYKIKQHKKRVNYTINIHTIDRFKVVADKDMRKISNIVENLIRRYVESRVWLKCDYKILPNQYILHLFLL